MALANQQVEINFSNMNSMEMVLKTNESLTERIKEKLGLGIMKRTDQGGFGIFRHGKDRQTVS